MFKAAFVTVYQRPTLTGPIRGVLVPIRKMKYPTYGVHKIVRSSFGYTLFGGFMPNSRLDSLLFCACCTHNCFVDTLFACQGRRCRYIQILGNSVGRIGYFGNNCDS
jgi:hypothetical protein